MTEQDHDLLIQINTKLERALIDIKDLKDDIAARVHDVEEDLQGLGRRVSALENWRWYIVGIASVLTVVANFVINKYLR